MAHPLQHRPMTWLAVVASALLCLMPTLGRLVHAHAGDSMSGMHGASGMQGAHAGMHHAGMHHAMAAEPAATPDHGRHADHGGPDCDYCPLLAQLVGSIAVAFVPAGLPGRVPDGTTRHAAAPTAAPVPSLGSQAPPSTA